MNLGLQEVVWITVGLLGLYAVMQLGRLWGLRRARRGAPPREEAPAPAAADFGLSLEVQHLRREVALLREQLDAATTAWEDGMRRLETEVLGLREGVQGIQAERSVPPQYGEALVFARRGLEAEAIAERCGISVAEAALVRSMAQAGDVPPEAHS
jgi:hypothetical protein